MGAGQHRTGLGARDIIMMVGMLAAGTINTICSKLQDEIKSVGIPGSSKRSFSHPAVQTLSMFIGETLCIFAFLILVRRQRSQPNPEPNPNPDTQPKKFPIWTFALPALCDMTATTLMYIGLLLTYPSVYQMLRGMIVVFTGIFSRLFLGRRLHPFHYLGMGLIIAGTVIVGLSSVLYDGSSTSAKNPLLGDVLVVAAQLVAATQMVVEEKFISRYNVPPLQVVGSEGMWGASATAIILFILYWIPPMRKIDNSLDALYQIKNSTPLALALAGSVLSIAFFNYFGISVTKYLSATHRTTIDASRVFLVWLASLLLRWEHFQWLQLVGFVVLLCGTSIFNEIIRLPFLAYPAKAVAPTTGLADHEHINEKKRLLASDD